MFCYSHLLSKGTEQYSQLRKLSHELQNKLQENPYHCTNRLSLWDLFSFDNFVSALLLVARNAINVMVPHAPSSLSTVKK